MRINGHPVDFATFTHDNATMGIILKPKPGNKPLSAEQIVKKLNAAGIEVRLDRDSVRRRIIEDILALYSASIEAPTAEIDFEQYDPLFRRWGYDCQIAFKDPRFVDIDMPGEEENALDFDGNWLWIGEAYPTDKDPLSVLVMRIAKLIDYDVQGE